MTLELRKLNEEIRKRAARVRLLALDSDGVLTDGGVYITDDGQEFRRFDIKDGQGLKRVRAAGIHVVIISGAAQTPVVHRARMLGITDVFVGVEDKLTLLTQICERLQMTLDQVAYIGDDLPDLPILERVGFPCVPSDAHEKTKGAVAYVSSFPGGYGAVRDICDLLLTVHQNEPTDKS